MKWSDIAFVPDAEAVDEAAREWQWLIPGPWKPLVSSMFGGLFLEQAAGGVFWLEMGTGELERVAASAKEFNDFLAGERNAAWHERVDEWFLPGFVQELHDAGMKPATGQCYGLTFLPIFAEGRYEIDNIFILPTREWFGFTGSMHQQMRDVPDGGKVVLKIMR